jgi:hypothetical protein
MKTLANLVADMSRLRNKTRRMVSSAPKIIGARVSADIRENFMRQGLMTDNGLQRWVPSASAIREKRRTLIDTGALMGGIHYEPTQKTVRVGVDTNEIPYAQKHGEGINITKRPFLYIRKAVINEVKKDLDAILKG